MLSSPGCLAAAALGAMLIVVPGCATPARPTEASRQRALTLDSQPLDGDYEVSISSRFFGPLRTRMRAEALPVPPAPASSSSPTSSEPALVGRFKANTNPGVAWNLIGGMPGALGPIMMPFIFPSGMLLYWESEVPTSSQPGMGKLGPSTLASLQATTRFYGPDRPVEISIENSGTIIAMEMTKLTADQAAQPLDHPDFPALVDAYGRVFREIQGFKGKADERAFEKYLASLRIAATKAKDDVEFIFALVLAWRDQKEFPMPAIFRRADRTAENRVFARTQGEQQPLKFTRDDATGILTIEVTAFIDPAQVDKVMTEALATKPRGIVLDLSNCTGFESAAFRLPSWIRPVPTPCGTLYPKELDPSELPANPTVYSIADLKAASGLDAALNLAARSAEPSGATPLAIRAEPVPNAFSGPLAVVVSSRTASTAEMLAHALGVAGVPIVGETTAKRPTLAREMDLNVPGAEEWIARIPRFDYIGPAGEWIKLSGVTPTHRAEKSAAVAMAKELVLQSKPVTLPTRQAPMPLQPDSIY
jgi:hypothetical protein